MAVMTAVRVVLLHQCAMDSGTVYNFVSTG